MQDTRTNPRIDLIQFVRSPFDQVCGERLATSLKRQRIVHHPGVSDIVTTDHNVIPRDQVHARKQRQRGHQTGIGQGFGIG